MNKLSIIFLIIIFLFLFNATIFVLIKNFLNQSELKQDKTESSLSSKDLSKITIVGWAAYWDEKNSINSLKTAVNHIDIFSPSFYRIDSSGSLGRMDVSGREEMLNMARTKSITIIPVIGDDFDFNRVNLVLYNKKIQEEFMNDLIMEAKKENFSGWNLGIESLKGKDKEAFSNFVMNVSLKLHENNLQSYITVFARDENDNFDAAVAHDYEEIGKHADKVILMTYGYHNEGTSPGAQTPGGWYRSVIENTEKYIPLHKIVLGLSTHGYDWNKEKVEGLTYYEIKERISNNNAKIKYDSINSSAIAIYESNGLNHEIWFEDEKTMNEKIIIAVKEYKIYNFAIWRIGAEDPNFWKLLNFGK